MKEEEKRKEKRKLENSTTTETDSLLTVKKLKTLSPSSSLSDTNTNSVLPQLQQRFNQLHQEDKIKREELEKVKKEEGEKVSKGYEEHLLCSICQEVQYKPIALVPCMHNVCGGCYAEWRETKKEDECPLCRSLVTQFSLNHLLSSLIETFLLSNPSKQRSKEDLLSLDQQFSKISHLVRLFFLFQSFFPSLCSSKKKLNKDLKAKQKIKVGDSIIENNYYEEEDEYYEEEDYNNHYNNYNYNNNYNPNNTNRRNVWSKYVSPYVAPVANFFSFYPKCKQCEREGGDGFKCEIPPSHLTCSYCNQLFPNRIGYPTKCTLFSLSFIPVIN